jgi:tetratricopeptide (TPR) repeat protein
MDNEPNRDLLIRAAEAYKGVVADPGEFGPVAASLVAEARRAGDSEALVLALRAEAWSERARLGNTRAKELLDEAVRVARRHRLNGPLGEVLVTRAAVNLELGHVAAAQHDLDRAEPLLRERGVAELGLLQAALLHNLGRLSDAAAVYRRALATPDCPVDVKAKVANNLALVESQRGHYRAALAHLDEAAKAAAEVGPALVAIVAQSRAWVTVQSGRLTESLGLFDEAARRYEVAGLPLGEHYIEYTDALVDLRLLPEASAMAKRAVELFEAHGILLMAAEAQLRAARLALLTGDEQGAADAERAARSFRRQRRTAWAAMADVLAVEVRARNGQVSVTQLRVARRAAVTLERLGIRSSAVEAYVAAGRLAVGLGRRGPALISLGRAQALARNAPVLVRLKGHVASALAARLGGHDQSVVQRCHAGLTDLARHRAAFASMELRALASGHGVELGRLGLDALVRAGQAARVLDWMERTRAAALFTVEPAATEGLEDELAALQVVEAELAQARRESGAEPPELLARQTAIESRLRRATWMRQASGDMKGAVLPPAELRRLLEGHVLVEFGSLDGQLFATVLEARRTRLVRLGPLEAVRFEANQLLFALRRLTRPALTPASPAGARASADLSLSRLTELLLRPLELPDDAPLVVIPSGTMQRLPWSALHPAPVSIAPSASFWARARQRRWGSGGEVVLIAGPELPGAVNEIQALGELHDRATVLLPPDSTVNAATKALDGASLAHLACHGRLRSDNPTFSSLLLSDGSMTVQELDLRGIAPHRLILAACDSAAGVSLEGDELLGFVSALIARGTAGIIASAVMVPDLEAVPFMRTLHEFVVRGATLAEALHAARATIDQTDPRSFVNWCAFTAFGAA